MRGRHGTRPLWRLAVRRARRRPGLVLLLVLVLGLAATALATVLLEGDGLLDAAVRDAVAAGGPADRGIQVSVQSDPALAAEQDHQVSRQLLRALGPAAADGVTRQWRSELLPVSGLRASPAGQLRVVAEVLPGAPAHTRLVAGRWPSAAGMPGELEAVLNAGAATVLGVRAGDAVPLTGADARGLPVRARVVGLWRPADPSDPFWFGDPRETTGRERATVVGPLLLAERGGLPAAGGIWTARWRAWVVPDRLSVGALSRISGGVAGLQARLADLPTGGGAAPVVEGGLPALLAAPAAVLPATRAAVVALLVLIAAVVGLLATLCGSLLAASRRDEVLTLRARGGSGLQRLGLAAGEVLAVGLLAVPAAAVVVLAAGSRLASAGAPRPGALPVITVTALCCLLTGLVMVLAGAAAARGPGDRSGRGRGRWAVDAALLAVTLLAGWQLRDAAEGRLLAVPGSGRDPVLVVAPSVALLGAAVLLVRLARRLSGGRWRRRGGSGRGRGLVGVLAGWSAARRGTDPAVPVVGLLLAAAACAVTLTGWRTVWASADDRAAAVLGADLVLDVPPAGAAAVLPRASALSARPGVRAVTPVAREPATVGSLAATLLAADTRTLAAVTGGAGRWSVPGTAAGLRDPLADQGIGLPAGRSLRLRIQAGTVPGSDTGLAFPPDPAVASDDPGTLTALARLADASGTPVSVDLGSVALDAPAADLTGRLPAAGDLRLVALDLALTPSGAHPYRAVDVAVLGLEVPGAAGGVRPAAGWRVFGADPGGGSGLLDAADGPVPGLPGVTVPPGFVAGLGHQVRLFPVRARPAPPVPAAVPALLSRRLVGPLRLRTGGTLTADVAGRPVPIRVAGVADRLPGGRPAGLPAALASDAPAEPGLLVDLATLAAYELATGADDLPVVTQWWLSSSTRSAVRAGSDLGTAAAGARIRSRSAEAAAAAAEPVPAGLRRLLVLAAAVALVSAVVTLWLAGAVSSGRRRGELAALRAVGMSRRQVRRSLGLEQLLVAVPAVASGTLLGLLAGRIVVPALTAAVPGAAPPPEVPWLPLAAAVAGLLLAVLVVVALGSRAAARLDPAAVLREGAG